MAAAAILKNHKNRDISAMIWPISMKFGRPMLMSVKEFEFRKSKMADGHHFENR